MVFWYGHNLGGWGWFAMSAAAILFWALITSAGAPSFRALLRSEGSGAPDATAPDGPAPERLLAERFARGEIGGDEYRRGLDVLRNDGRPLDQR
ncbi:SHOCT domain-containing protein [Streptomyces sp. NPDC055722]